MKKNTLILLITALLFTMLLTAEASYAAVGSIPLNSTTFPDNTFRAYIADNYDTDHDSALSLDERNAVVNLQLDDKGITSLTGIEYFYYLKTLECSGNPITELMLHDNANLQTLSCNGCKLEILELPARSDYYGSPVLMSVACANNELYTIRNLSDCINLQDLHCQNNNLYSLVVSSNTLLETLDCSGNHLLFVDLAANTALEHLNANQSYSIEYRYDQSVPLDVYELDGFDLDFFYKSKFGNVSGFTGGTVNSSGIISCPGAQINYIYDTHACVSNHYISVTLYKCVPINEKTFPDVNFRYCISDPLELDLDINKDGRLMGEELSSVTSLDVSGQDIKDLTGIEHFCSLTDLNCYGNQIESLDISKNTNLEILDCSANCLKCFDISKNPGLTKVDCSKNALTSFISDENTSLIWLYCESNLLTNLDVSRLTGLTNLSCSYNELTDLDVKANIGLIFLSCMGNRITELDLSKNTELKTIKCMNNALASLCLSGNTKIEKFSISPQNIEVNSIGGLDLSDYMSRSSIGNVTPLGGAFLSDTLVFCTDSTFTYTYDTGNSETGEMTVKMYSAKYSFGTWKLEPDGSNSICVTVDSSGQYSILFLRYESGRPAILKMQTVSLLKGAARNFIEAPFQLQPGDKVFLIDTDSTPVTTALPI